MRSAKTKAPGTGSDARHKEARVAKSEQARLAADHEETTEIWSAHYEEMDAMVVANENLTEMIEARRAHTETIQNQTNALEFEAAAQRALHEGVMQEQNKLRGIGQQWLTHTRMQGDNIERLRQEIAQAHREIACEEEIYSHDKCEVHYYRGMLDDRLSRAVSMREEANAEELLAQQVKEEDRTKMAPRPPWRTG